MQICTASASEILLPGRVVGDYHRRSRSHGTGARHPVESRSDAGRGRVASERACTDTTGIPMEAAVKSSPRSVARPSCSRCPAAALVAGCGNDLYTPPDWHAAGGHRNVVGPTSYDGVTERPRRPASARPGISGAARQLRGSRYEPDLRGLRRPRSTSTTALPLALALVTAARRLRHASRPRHRHQQQRHAGRARSPTREILAYADDSAGKEERRDHDPDPGELRQEQRVHRHRPVRLARHLQRDRLRATGDLKHGCVVAYHDASKEHRLLRLEQR